MKILKLLGFSIWIALWLAITCYGFRIMPVTWALWFDGNYNDAVRIAPILGVLIDTRPGGSFLGTIALVVGGMLSASLYFKCFDAAPIENK